MGQQQLLLMVLVTIIVGIATVVAVNTFQSASEDANFDALRVDILQAHAMANSYIIKPKVFGGGGGSYEDISLLDLNLPVENENARYELGEINSDSFQIIATAARGFIVTATISGNDVSWERDDL